MENNPPVSQYMSRTVVTMDRDTPIDQVVTKMALMNIGAVVITAGEEPVGIFTERDAVKRVLARRVNTQSAKVALVMTPKFVAVAPEDGLHEVCQRMRKGNFRHLPVVESGKLVGILSIRDVATALEGLAWGDPGGVRPQLDEV